MTLYHYTSLKHLWSILADGEIKLTASNLLRPVRPHLVNGSIVDETDSYRPVVWFTNSLDFNRAIGCGLYDEKTEAVIVINSADKPLFRKWTEWAVECAIDETWFRALKETAPQWNTFYITEKSVKIDDNVKIIFRPDIRDELGIALL